MIVQENLGNGLVRTYSNSGFKVHGGVPEGDYDIAYDPEDSGRTYVETNIPVDSESKARDLSRVKLYRKFRAMGIWDGVKTWMQSQDGVWEEWEYSTTLEEDNELVKSAKAALKTSFGLTDEQIAGIIEECRA